MCCSQFKGTVRLPSFGFDINQESISYEADKLELLNIHDLPVLMSPSNHLDNPLNSLGGTLSSNKLRP